MSNSLRPHGLKHARHACPLLSPGGCSNSYVHWVDDAILFAPFSSCPQSFPASGSLPVSRFFTSGLPLHHQGSLNICHFWSNLSLTILFPQSPLLSPAERERDTSNSPAGQASHSWEFPTRRKVKVKSFSRVWLFATPWTVAHHASPSMGFSRQEYWSGLPFPSPEDLPDPGIEPGSPAL